MPSLHDSAYTSCVEGLARTIRRVQVGVYSVANGDTEDVVQEALARAIKSGVSLEAEQWLRTVAKRVAIDQHRRRRETPSGAAEELERYEQPAPDGDPETAYIRAERSQAVREAMAALPPRYRKALQAYAEEDSPAAVASRLGLSAAATWTLLSRARTRLRLQLEQVGFVPALVSVARARWREIAAAGATAGVAATATFAPTTAPRTPSDVPEPKVVHVTAPVTADEPVAKKDALPVAVPNVKDTVNDAVDDVVKDVPAKVAVTTCVGRPAAPAVELDIELVDETPDTGLGRLIQQLPEPLRVLGEKTCV